MDSWLRAELDHQEIKELTTVQIAAIDAGLAAGESMVVCAPTSSGKTLVGEIALLAGIKEGCTALYLVSHKAIADQKYEEFSVKYGSRSTRKVARIGISTGDRDEGDDDPQILIATYEKALSLVMSDAISIGNSIIVADELQIIGEDKRGPEIEILCAALRRRRPKQFVALTATIENGNDFSGWLECKLVQTTSRDVDLIQQIWAHNECYSLRFGDDVGTTSDFEGRMPKTTIEAVDLLLQRHLGPILVFTETRRDAMDLAESFSQRRAKTPSGFNFSEQLSLFSEPTEFSDRLKSTGEKKVAFHTADLTANERSVVEKGLLDSDFDVCFATPTLAAGVNFPFQTVLFDRIRRRYIPPPPLPISSYRNMSGRAGRLGMHDTGYSVLLPRDNEELAHANALIMPDNEYLSSKLSAMSVRKIVLSLISSKIADNRENIKEFFKQTLFWYQVQERNPHKLDELIHKVDEAIAWLIDNEMAFQDGSLVACTELGGAASKTGLLPSTAVEFASLIRKYSPALCDAFADYELPLIHAACCCDEFDATIGQRFLPPLNPGADGTEVFQTLSKSPLFYSLSTSPRGANNSAYAIFLFMMGEIERKISHRSGIPSGQVHRFSADIAWIFDGLHRIAGVSSLGCPQKIMNQIGILARRVRWGVPTEAVDLLRTCHAARVPGFGRQRALALLRASLGDRASILTADRAQLEGILGSKERTDRLIEAIESSTPNSFERSRRLHLIEARELALEQVVSDSYTKYGGDYEDPIIALLQLQPDWRVTKLDDGKRKGVPDLLVEFGGKSIVIECKTTTKTPAVINKEDAFSVLTKAADIKGVHRITLGKPCFDTFSESRACGSSEITLINHATFVSAILLVRKGEVAPEKLFNWLLEPGVAEIDRLSEI